MTWGCSGLTDEDGVGSLPCNVSAQSVWPLLKWRGNFTCKPGIGNKKSFGKHFPLNHKTWEKSKGNVIGMFRQPEQRILSAMSYDERCGLLSPNADKRAIAKRWEGG